MRKPYRSGNTRTAVNSHWRPFLVGAVQCGLILAMTTLYKSSTDVSAGNFISPVLGVPQILMPNADGTVDVTIEVQSMTEDVTIDASDRTK